MLVKARIMGIESVTDTVRNSEDLKDLHHDDLSNYGASEYTISVPGYLMDREAFLIARGMFFDNDWSADDTISVVWKEELKAGRIIS